MYAALHSEWVDFKLENVLVSLHFLKTMAPLFLRNGELLGHSPMHICVDDHQCSIVTSNLIKHARNITRIRMESCIHGRRPVYPSRHRLPSNSPFLKNNGAIVFKKWRDTRTFSNLKSTHCTLLILLIINLVTRKSLCIVSKVQREQ
jgi:hypothetical protein